MGGVFSAIGDFFADIFNYIGDFFKAIGDFFVGLWDDLTWAFYVCEDLLILAGPFLGFLLYALLTPAKTEVNEKIVVNVDLDDLAGI